MIGTESGKKIEDTGIFVVKQAAYVGFRECTATPLIPARRRRRKAC